MKVALAIAPAGPEYLEARLAFHLRAGVDLVIASTAATDERSSEILETYVRAGYAVRAPAPRDSSGADTQALVARVAAEHAADWLITAAANEFWWPRGVGLKDVLVAVPPRYGVVQALVRDFVPRAGQETFAERMTVRSSLASASAGREPLWHLLRSVQRLVPGAGAHGGQPLRAWYPIEVFRFPDEGVTETLSEEDVARRLAEGSLVVDVRLRDALRVLRDESGYRLPGDGEGLTFPAPTVVDDAEYAVECAAVGEVDLDRLDRQIRELEGRIATLEQGFWPRVARKASALTRGRTRRRS